MGNEWVGGQSGSNPGTFRYFIVSPAFSTLLSVILDPTLAGDGEERMSCLGETIAFCFLNPTGKNHHP
jgi:hypothetical protein